MDSIPFLKLLLICFICYILIINYNLKWYPTSKLSLSRYDQSVYPFHSFAYCYKKIIVPQYFDLFIHGYLINGSDIIWGEYR